MMSYKLSNRSMSELVGVHPILAFTVTEAIKITKQDFMVLDGTRSIHEQQKLVDRGVSKTMDSYHLYGLAADLVAYVDGKPSWDSKYYKEIGKAMKKVIKEHKLYAVQWGFELWGWDMPHWQMSGYKKLYDVRKLNYK